MRTNLAHDGDTLSFLPDPLLSSLVPGSLSRLEFATPDEACKDYSALASAQSTSTNATSPGLVIPTQPTRL